MSSLVGALNAFADHRLDGKVEGHFGEQLRLQLREVTEKARHTSVSMMLGQPVGCKNKRKSRVSWRREPIFLAGKPMYSRVRVARVKRVVYGRLEASVR